MLRNLLLYFSEATWLRRIITGWSFSRRAAARFIAGDTLEEAIEVVRSLNSRGLFVTLDHLGENVTNESEAEKATRDYLSILEGIDRAKVEATISLKLTQLGLRLDPGLCLANMRRIAERASELGNFVRIDMEDSECVQMTLDIQRNLQDEGQSNVGVVIQAYLYRSEADLQSLLSAHTHVRLCKGAYKEPPDVAYPAKADVDANFDQLARMMLDAARDSTMRVETGNSRKPPRVAIATHDEARISHARGIAEEQGLPRGIVEFQMLYGIATNLQLSLVQEQYPVRVYVPFGTEWYPYYTRRLAERPANLWFLLSNLFRR